MAGDGDADGAGLEAAHGRLGIGDDAEAVNGGVEYADIAAGPDGIGAEHGLGVGLVEGDGIWGVAGDADDFEGHVGEGDGVAGLAGEVGGDDLHFLAEVVCPEEGHLFVGEEFGRGGTHQHGCAAVCF